MRPRSVSIQNIVAINSTRGEFFGLPEVPDVLTRMEKHIRFLATYTRTQHEARMNEDSELVTRLVLNEFSLYTKNRPLTLEEYKQLIHIVNKIALTLPPNIHLVLATFPVIWPDGRLHNVGLHVQSPRKATLASF